MKPIILVDKLSKQYQIGRRQASYGTLRESLMGALGASARGARGLLNGSRENGQASDDRFWALRDVSFEVQSGDVVGIIGRNGAGKSTLLKILSRITEPTMGTIKLWGRVASLLEVGTGFHSELTGRENIYLNGSILGMRKAEVARKFDEIVAFAGVEEFLDTPVKRYSSGMHVRLAFAVSAHLEPEVLVIDEVLAVGDAEFQRKCVGKMRDVSTQGRTVLFVSHNMASIQALCGRGLLLSKGRIIEDGPIHDVVQAYLSEGEDPASLACFEPDPASAPGDDVVKILRIRALDADGDVRGAFTLSEPVAVEIVFRVLRPNFPLDTFCYFVDDFGRTCFVSIDNLDSPWKDTVRKPGLYRSVCHVPPHFLNEGRVHIHALVRSGGTYVHAVARNVSSFVMTDDMDPGGVRGNYSRQWPEAAVRPRLHWDVSVMVEESLCAAR